MVHFEKEIDLSKELKNSIQVIERMMSLLDTLAHHSEPITLKQLAQQTQLHPSTAHRILGAMVNGRVVDRIEPSSYQLGLRLLELGNLVKSRLNFRQTALPYMQQLHQELRETVHLSVRYNDEVVYVERISSSAPMMRVVQVVGSRAPLHVTAVGKVYLANEPEKCSEYVERTGLPAFTPNSVKNLKSLLEELKIIQQQGYAFDREEAEKGVSCIAAGIRDDDGNLIAGLSISAPTERLNSAWASLIKETANSISTVLGYREKPATKVKS